MPGAPVQVVTLSTLSHVNIVRYMGTCREESMLYIFEECVPFQSETCVPPPRRAGATHSRRRFTHTPSNLGRSVRIPRARRSLA